MRKIVIKMLDKYNFIQRGMGSTYIIEMPFNRIDLKRYLYIIVNDIFYHTEGLIKKENGRISERTHFRNIDELEGFIKYNLNIQ